MHTTIRTPDLTRHRRSTRGVRLAAGLVALAVAVAVGAAIGRGTGDHGGSPVPADGPPPARTSQSGPGPTRIADGVPIGYVRTRDGAVAAAANYAVVLDSPVVLDSTRVDAALDRMVTAGARDDFADRFELASSLLDERLDLETDNLEPSGVVMRTVPLGYRVLAHSAEATTVAVWVSTLFVAPGSQAVGPDWGTTELTLRWEDGDWRVAELGNSDGPVPPAAGSETAAAVGAQIQSFEPLWQTPPTEG